MAFRHALRVRFRDLDGMGHVNHAVYLTYLEEARIAYLTRAVGPINADDPFPFLVARVEVDYKKPARVGEELITTLQVSRFGRSSFDFSYSTEDAAGTPVLAARTVQVFVDRNGASTPIPESFRRAVEDFQKSFHT